MNRRGFMFSLLVSLELAVRASATPTVIDNGTAGFSSTAGWNNSNGGSGYLASDNAYASAGTGTKTANWTFSGLTPNVAVYLGVSYSAFTNRATNSPFTVFDSNGTTLLGTVAVNQRQDAGNFTYSNINYYYLGRFTPTGTSIKVQLTDNANGVVIADSVWLDTSPPSPLYIVSIAPGGLNDGTKWQGGVAPSGSLYGRVLHAMTLTSNYTVGDGTDVVCLDFSNASASLTITGAILRLRGNAQFGSYGYAGSARGWLAIDGTSGVASGIELDGNSGVAPHLLWGQGSKLTITGQTKSYANTHGEGDYTAFIRTKSGSAGNQGYSRAVASSPQSCLVTASYAEFYRLGSLSQAGFGSALTNSGNSSTWSHCYFDIASCVGVPYVIVSDGGAIDSVTDCQWGNYGDVALVSGHVGSYYATFLGNSVANTTGSRTFLRNRVYGDAYISMPDGSFEFFMETRDRDVQYNTFQTFWGEGSVPSPGAKNIANNLMFVDAIEGGITWGDSLNNYVVAGNNTSAFLFMLDYSHTHDGNVLQHNGTQPIVGHAPNDGIRGNPQFTIKNEIIFAKNGGGVCLASAFSPSSSRPLDWTTVSVEHCTIVSASSAYSAVLSSGNGTAQVGTPHVSSCKSNIVVSPQSGAYLARSDSVVGTAPPIVDVIPASACDYNCWQGLSLSRAGQFSGIKRDTGVEDGTVYRSPMSGRIVPGAHDKANTDPQFVDSTRCIEAWAVTQGSMSKTDAGKLQDAFAYCAANPTVQIPSLVTWVKNGFVVKNPALKNAGHDGVTIGAMPFQAGDPLLERN
jgi:hypothetical protein